MKSELAELVKDKYVTLVNFQRKNGITNYASMVHTLHFRRRDKSTMKALRKLGITQERFEKMKSNHFAPEEA